MEQEVNRARPCPMRGWCDRICCTDPAAVNFNCDRALQQTDGQDELQSRLDSSHDSGDTAQRPIFDPGDLADLQIRPGHYRNAALSNALDCGDLLFFNRNGRLADSNDLD